MKVFRCNKCSYISDRKYNIQKHINRIHSKECMDIENNENDMFHLQTDIVEQQNKFICKTCNKLYKTMRHLSNHEKLCNKVDSLTCPRCMVYFTHRNSRNRHIKANKCKARSIIYARTPNIQNISNSLIQNITNNDNSINNNNNIFINNFGSERIDHITNNDIAKMLQSGIHTIPMYIQMKHFDKNFPENRNIMYTDDNKCKIMEDNCWKEKDLTWLSSNLIKCNSEVLLLHCEKNDIMLSATMKDNEKFEHIRNKLIFIYNKCDCEKYNQILTMIKDMIKNSYNENKALL